MKKNYSGVRVLVLGGASVHCKLVAAAQSLGLYVIVADYLSSSPAKKIADEDVLIDIRNVDALERLCRERGVRAVLSTHLDPGQRPYQELCARLNLPCYGTKEMFYAMTDKTAFKALCRENGVSVIDEYSLEDVRSGKCKFPLFVKPVDSRGSRGQSVCKNVDEVVQAVKKAERESSNGKYIIEDYLGSAKEVQITYFFVRGDAYLVRTVDSYRGLGELSKVVLCSISPSVYTDRYLAGAHVPVVNMLKKLGMVDGPVFMQGFYDRGIFKFFDPGLRFPGVDYEIIFKHVFGIDLLKMLWIYALTGAFPPEMKMPSDAWKIKGQVAAVLFPVMMAGCIKRIDGCSDINDRFSVVAYSLRHMDGDIVPWSFDVNQRYAEVDILCSNKEAIKSEIGYVQRTLMPVDEHGRSLVYSPISVDNIE